MIFRNQFGMRGPAQPVQVPVPFLGRSVAAGDAIKNLTQAVGVQPCGGCQQRQQALNQMLRFVPMRRPW